MPAPVLTLHSEPYAATGNIGDGGFRKLLGTPTLGVLATVLREAIQNSCDAAKQGTGPRIAVRLRHLTAVQMKALQRHVLPELPAAADSRSRIQQFLNDPNPTVLEICDFGTTGLGGPTRADRLPNQDCPTDFIDFLRNVGTNRDTRLGGGTYGFGKVSLYSASRCSTIIVDSQTDGRSQFERRLIACHLGPAATVKTPEGTLRRYTGRHWWGINANGDDVADPALNDEARSLSEALGMQSRGLKETGTSIMILAPALESTDLEMEAHHLLETLLWNFWPRLMKTCPPERRIVASMEADARIIDVPDPETFPPFDLFSKAMNLARTGDPACEEIMCQRPAKRLGSLAIAKGLRAPRTPLVPADSLLPSPAHHIAVMRPVELVVKYIEGSPLPDERLEWAGVFLASSEDEVERAFAEAEPPAHDDWVPENMPKGHRKTYVNVALRELRSRSQSIGAGPAPVGNASPANSPLAAVSTRLGAILSGSPGDAPSRKTSTTSRKAQRRRISSPAFDRLELVAGQKTAIFRAELSGSGREDTVIAEAHLALEGTAVSGAPESGETQPAVMSIEGPPTGSGSGERLHVGAWNGTLLIRTSVPDDRACTVTLRLVEGTAG